LRLDIVPVVGVDWSMTATQHRADAYCHVCGGACRDERTIKERDASWGFYPRKLDIRPFFTGPGETSFKPARKEKRL
jgi:hypothetical protein